jgi:CRISPR-associated protein (TIGR02584 family)
MAGKAHGTGGHAAEHVTSRWREVVLFVAGTTPQIITETLWALRQETPEFSPAAIHVITTLQGRAVTQRRLLNEKRLALLCHDLGIPNPPALEFHLLRRSDGKALDDVRDTQENTALANTILRVVRDLTAEPESRLSASLSGGRKTMGFFMGYAMSLFGRPQDALYHVMTAPEWERVRDFFYIPREPQMMTSTDGREMSTADARIELAEIPFLRLRHSVKEPILQSKVIDFAALTSVFQAALEPPSLRFFDDECRLACGSHCFALRPQLYALYRVFAETCSARVPGAGPAGLGPDHSGWLTSHDFATEQSRGVQAYLGALERTLRVSESTLEWTRGYARSWGDGSKAGRARMGKLFNPIFARLREALAQVGMDPLVRSQIWLHTEGRNPARYGLVLEPGQISLDG